MSDERVNGSVDPAAERIASAVRQAYGEAGVSTAIAAWRDYSEWDGSLKPLAREIAGRLGCPEREEKFYLALLRAMLSESVVAPVAGGGATNGTAPAARGALAGGGAPIHVADTGSSEAAAGDEKQVSSDPFLLLVKAYLANLRRSGSAGAMEGEADEILGSVLGGRDTAERWRRGELAGSNAPQLDDASCRGALNDLWCLACDRVGPVVADRCLSAAVTAVEAQIGDPDRSPRRFL